MASLHQLIRTGARAKRRVGRGQSSGRGKTSGRGTKGQNARSGRKKRPEMRDIIKKIPKRRGYGKNRGRTVVGNRVRAIPVSLEQIGRLFDSSHEVTPTSLSEKLALSRRTKRRLPPFKIVGGGTLEKKISFKGVFVSASARSVIEKSGGTIV